MPLNQKTNSNCTARQLKLPLEIEKIIDISDPVYTFCEVMDHIDLSKYFVEKGYKTGRPRCDVQKLLKVILFAFMDHGFSSLSDIEKMCKTDIRFMYLLDDMKAPSFATFGNFIRDELTESVEEIFNDINTYIFDVDKVDLDHTYIDGTKIEANANRYSWVWKKSCIKNRDKVFEKVSSLIDEINDKTLSYLGIKIEKREEYAIDYLENILDEIKKVTGVNPKEFVNGRGHRKTMEQRQYQKLEEYKDRLKAYARHIEVCGEQRNSYSKTDHSATFMRVKSDYMGNGQLLPAYNLQAAICDEYIAVVD
ncbi:MAG: transposase [Roseburia sp.]